MAIKKTLRILREYVILEVTPRIELGNRGFADLGLTAWLCHQYMIKDTRQKNGAENETRTRDPHLGKVMLYQLSYFRIFTVFVSALRD